MKPPNKKNETTMRKKIRKNEKQWEKNEKTMRKKREKNEPRTNNEKK